MSIAAQQRNTNEVTELLKWVVALPTPSLTITTTGAVKFALIEDEISKFDRVFDRYFEFSTKSVTRTKRSGDQGTRYRVVGNTPLPGNWTTFLKSVENKRELSKFFAKRIVETVLVGAGKIFIATCNENV